MKRMKKILFYTFIIILLLINKVEAETYEGVTKYLRSPYIVNLTTENEQAIEKIDPNHIPVNPILGQLQDGTYVYCYELKKNWDENGTFTTGSISNNKKQLTLILANSFPYINISELRKRFAAEVSACSSANCNQLTYQEAITAIQGAIWYYTDNNKVTSIYNGYDISHYPTDYQIPSQFNNSNSTNGENIPAGAETRINLLYNWLINLETPSITVKITNSTITYDNKTDLYTITTSYTVTAPSYLTLNHTITIGDTTSTNPTVNNNTYTVTTTQSKPTANIKVEVTSTVTDGSLVSYNSTDDEIQDMIGFKPTTTTISNTQSTNVSLLELTIKANNDCDETLEGFTYTITDSNNSKESCTTNTTGTCTIKGLSKGDYTLTQTAIPNDNYILNSEVKDFTITQTEVETGTKTIEANPNACNTTTLDLIIKTNNDCDEVLEGFTYTITGPDNLEKSCTTNKTGTCTIKELTEGNYTLKQTAVPNNQYILNTEEKEFAITPTDIQKGTKTIETNPNTCEEIPESPQTGLKTLIIVISSLAIISLIIITILYKKKFKITK